MRSSETVASKVNHNPYMSLTINWKAVRGRYKHLQDDFDADNTMNSHLSGVGTGEMGELYQALPHLREGRDTFLKEMKSKGKEKWTL